METRNSYSPFFPICSFNYTSISDACPFCCGVNLPIGKPTIQLQEIEDTQHGYLVSSHLTVSLSSLHLM